MQSDSAGVIRREVTTLVFDQYGTIVDMQGGLTEAVTPFLAGKGWSVDPHRFVTWWRRTHFEDSMIDSLCDRGHTSYRQIGHRAVANVMRRCGIDHTHDEVRWLVGFDRAAEAVSRRAGCAGAASPAVSPRHPLERRSGHAGSRKAAYRIRVRCGDLGRGGRLLQTASRDLRQGLREARHGPFEHPLRRQPRVRLHRLEGVRNAHRIHRSAPAALRRFGHRFKMRQFIFTHTSGPVPRHAVLGVGGVQ